MPTLNIPHFVNNRPLRGPYPEDMEQALFAMGCFWGAERLFWQFGDGIWITAAGYAGGEAAEPSYEQVCAGATGHAETVLVVFDPETIRYEDLLQAFWTNHDPTQGIRQGNDIGSQYRSALYVSNERQHAVALASRAAYDDALRMRGFGPITTEIAEAGPFYFAEDHHQQYLAKNPHGYCGLRGTGVDCAI